MRIPIIGGAALYKGAKLVRDGIPVGTGPAFFWGVVASAVTGFFAIYVVFRVLKTRSYTPFVIYRVAAGVAVLLIIATGFRPAS